MLRCATDLVSSSGGLRVSLEGLSLDAVIRAAGVPRTSVYRIWPNREAFHIDLMCALATPDWSDPATMGDGAVARVREIVARSLPRLGTVAGRRALLRDLGQSVVEERMRRLVASPTWRTSIALTATALSLEAGQERDRLLTAMRDAELATVDHLAALYQDVATILGCRLRDGLSHRQLSLGVNALVDGLCLRMTVMPEVASSRVAVPATEIHPRTEWAVVAYAVVLAFEAALEFVEDYDSGQALARYLRSQVDPSGTWRSAPG